MKFKGLNENDIKVIVDSYSSFTSKKEAQEFLASLFKTSTRSIRSWVKKLGLVEDKSCLDFTKLNKGGVKKGSNVLVIGDLHEPFCIDGYLEFCKNTYNKYNCNKVIFIGDVIDNHHSSYHETDSDGMGGGDELELAISKISKWCEVFPVADVMLGNHDIIIMRKAQTGSIPKKWIKSYKEVLETPNWNFVDEVLVDGVLYHHGIGAKAHMKAIRNMVSTVGGHHHTACYVQWFVGKAQRIFGMQVGCGIDIKSYAMAYGKWFPKPAIGCGVVINGEVAINEMMNL